MKKFFVTTAILIASLNVNAQTHSQLEDIVGVNQSISYFNSSHAHTFNFDPDSFEVKITFEEYIEGDKVVEIREIRDEIKRSLKKLGEEEFIEYEESVTIQVQMNGSAVAQQVFLNMEMTFVVMEAKIAEKIFYELKHKGLKGIKAVSLFNEDEIQKTINGEGTKVSDEIASNYIDKNKMYSQVISTNFYINYNNYYYQNQMYGYQNNMNNTIPYKLDLNGKEMECYYKITFGMK